MSENPQLQDPQQQDVPSNDSSDAAREQRLLEAFKDGVPRAPDGTIDVEAAFHLLLQHGADLPTVMVITKLAEEKTREMQQQMQADEPKMSDFGLSLRGRPRPSPPWLG
jgi:hypothetical protein